MNDSDHVVLEMLEEFGAIHGVRGALIATSSGALVDGQGSGVGPVVANDIAKTVRRVVVASATVGSPLDELQINFGVARMMIVPLLHETTLVVMLERDTATEPVNRFLSLELNRLNALLGVAMSDPDEAELTPTSDEVSELMTGELGPVLVRIQECLAVYLQRAGIADSDATGLMRTQMQEWLQCCSPSAYTFPLLLDGLAQEFNQCPEHRSEFVSDVHAIWSESGSTGDSIG